MPDPLPGGFNPNVPKDDLEHTEELQNEPKNKLSENQNEEQTVGKQIVKQRFNPHPEMPEEVPTQIKEVFHSAISGDEDEKDTRLEKIWRLFRTGLGGVLVEGEGWDYNAKFLISYAEGDAIDLPGGVSDDPKSNLIHLLRNLNILVGLTEESYEKNRLIAPLFSREDEITPEELATIIDLNTEVLKLQEKIIENRKNIKNDENLMNLVGGKIEEFDTLVRKCFREEALGDGDLNSLLSVAKEISNITSEPYWLIIASASKYLSHIGNSIQVKVSEGLSAPEKILFEESYFQGMISSVSSPLSNRAGEHRTPIK